MADWLVLSQTVTAGGFAHDFGVDMGGTLEKLHIIAAERQGGGDDTVIPRRAAGLGADAQEARADLDETVSRYDPSGRVVFSR